MSQILRERKLSDSFLWALFWLSYFIFLFFFKLEINHVLFIAQEVITDQLTALPVPSPFSGTSLVFRYAQQGKTTLEEFRQWI